MSLFAFGAFVGFGNRGFDSSLIIDEEQISSYLQVVRSSSLLLRLDSQKLRGIYPEMEIFKAETKKR